MITREEWLRHAVELIDKKIYHNDLRLNSHPFQIACGWTSRTNALGECIQPSDTENPTLDDFFPTTIHIRCTIKDPVEMIGVLVHECIHAFYNIHGHKKDFGAHAGKVGFEKPYTKYHPSTELVETCKEINRELIATYGPFPGKAIVPAVKEKKEHKSNTILLFCPTCGYEVKVSRKMFEKHDSKFPTCICGTRMAQDLEDEQESNQD